jgi:uncharacterized protein with FMN-binding domain
MDQPDSSAKPAPPDKGRASGGKISNSLVALSSSAVLTVYAAGYVRTRSAAERFAVEAADLRTAAPSAGGGATAAPPREFVDAVKTADTAPTVPAAPGPTSVSSAAPDGTVSPQPSPAPIADSTGAASQKEPTGPKGPGLLPPPPTEEPTTPTPAAQTINAAPADVDTKAAEPPAAPPVARQAQYKDGTYFGWGYSRHGDIQASVAVQDGRIVAAQITQCLTRYSCDVIDMLPSQVLSRQNAYVDLISGATESANAFSNAIYRALALSK